MKSKNFLVSPNHITSTSTEQIIAIPILPAFAIEHGILYVNGQAIAIAQTGISIANGKNVIWNIAENGYDVDSNDTINLTIYYHGIRDYRLLFPTIGDPARQTRLGQFYEEAEACFEAGSWMSFMLMSGAIFEHILYDKLKFPNEDTLHALISKAQEEGIIAKEEAGTIKLIKEFRNVIHASKLNMPYVAREQVMDTKSLIDKIIVRFSYEA